MQIFSSLLLTAGTCLVLGFAPPASAATTGSGRMATEQRAVSGFEAVATTGSIDLVLRQTGKEAVEVQADDNLLPLIETVVERGSRGPTLQVRLKRGERVHNHGQIRVTVDVVQLKAVSTAGSGDIVVDGLKTPSFHLSIAGASDARLNGLATELLDLRISGSGDVQAAGTATSVKLSIAGSGDANLAALVADDVHVRIAGSGDASVTANKVLDVSVAGSGDVRYGGSATTVKSSTAGSGTVSRR
ncbi:head GIN domain-containing protein [Rubrivivax sp. RP6-9]|uniref:head GIN domain-containing protein n=1 Tax=Rubrivivax sp. RP6-9 TaxID=3415750 RepID=UPI003CC5FC01